ncbi:hypothetical protein [Bernardetia sp.]|uniref:hypothetical protein n=1 Tax=Bernardetia sp. TaxID=1937974 RepID=UPI0025C56B31|nr:hypothetical protein [Bernardetia sp.]
MSSFEILKNKSKSDLDILFENSSMATFENIEGYSFIGYNTNSITGFLGFRNFIKVFETSQKTGYNIIVSQNKTSNHSNYIKKNKKGKPLKQGFYALYNPAKIDIQGLVIDYGKGKNHFLEPARFLKDYLVVPYPQKPNILLGKAFLKIGKHLFFLSYFILKKFKPLSQL